MPSLGELRAVQPVVQMTKEENEELRSAMKDYVKPSYNTKKKHVVRGQAVSTANTIIASGELTWLGEGKHSRKSFPAVTSGNPMHKTRDRVKGGLRGVTYIPERLYENYKESDTGLHSDCAEQKIVKQARSAISGIAHYSDEDPAPTLTIYSEKTPCSSCETKIQELRDAFKNLTIVIRAGATFRHKKYGSTWDYATQNNDQVCTLDGQTGTGSTPGYVVSKPKPKPKVEKKEPSLLDSNPFAALMNANL